MLVGLANADGSPNPCHNQHGRFAKHAAALLRFLRGLDVNCTSNAGASGLRMSKAKTNVSGCFRAPAYGKAYARISSHLQSIAALGYKPLVTIQIALADHAIDTISQHYSPPQQTPE